MIIRSCINCCNLKKCKILHPTNVHNNPKYSGCSNWISNDIEFINLFENEN